MKEKLLLLLLPRLLFSLLSMDGKVHSISATEKQKSERMRRRRRWKRSFYLCLLHSHTHKQTDRQSDKPKEGSPIRSWRAICNRFLIANNNARLTRWWCVCVSFRFVSFRAIVFVFVLLLVKVCVCVCIGKRCASNMLARAIPGGRRRRRRRSYLSRSLARSLASLLLPLLFLLLFLFFSLLSSVCERVALCSAIHQRMNALFLAAVD